LILILKAEALTILKGQKISICLISTKVLIYCLLGEVRQCTKAARYLFELASEHNSCNAQPYYAYHNLLFYLALDIIVQYDNSHDKADYIYFGVQLLQSQTQSWPIADILLNKILYQIQLQFPHLYHEILDTLKQKSFSDSGGSIKSLSLIKRQRNLLTQCDLLLNSELSRAPLNEVTIIFTDVECSTILWETFPRAMEIALEKHDKILRDLLKEFNGYEVKTEGDAFMVAFFNALDAILWAINIQLQLLQTEWP